MSEYHGSNPGKDSFDVGSVEGHKFTVSAIGSDIVIRPSDSNIPCQIIHACSHYTGQMVSTVSCCRDSGKVAVTCGEIVRIFKPVSVQHEEHTEMLNRFPYTWEETDCFTVRGCVNTVKFNKKDLSELDPAERTACDSLAPVLHSDPAQEREAQELTFALVDFGIIPNGGTSEARVPTECELAHSINSSHEHRTLTPSLRSHGDDNNESQQLNNLRTDFVISIPLVEQQAAYTAMGIPTVIIENVQGGQELARQVIIDSSSSDLSSLSTIHISSSEESDYGPQAKKQRPENYEQIEESDVNMQKNNGGHIDAI